MLILMRKNNNDLQKYNKSEIYIGKSLASHLSVSYFRILCFILIVAMTALAGCKSTKQSSGLKYALPPIVTPSQQEIQEARLGVNTSAIYKVGAFSLIKSQTVDELNIATRYLCAAARKGSDRAQYLLGQLYLGNLRNILASQNAKDSTTNKREFLNQILGFALIDLARKNVQDHSSASQATSVYASLIDDVNVDAALRVQYYLLMWNEDQNTMGQNIENASPLTVNNYIYRFPCTWERAIQ